MRRAAARQAVTRLTTATISIMHFDLKLGRAEALRRAMLAYMNDKASPLNAHPAFWARKSATSHLRCAVSSNFPLQ
jgi:hypothetical protein